MLPLGYFFIKYVRKQKVFIDNIPREGYYENSMGKCTWGSMT